MQKGATQKACKNTQKLAKEGRRMRKGCNQTSRKTCKSQPAEGCNQGATGVQLGCNQGAKGCNPKSLQKHTKTGPVGRASINTRLGEPVPIGWVSIKPERVGRTSIKRERGQCPKTSKICIYFLHRRRPSRGAAGVEVGAHLLHAQLQPGHAERLLEGALQHVLLAGQLGVSTSVLEFL